jgi:hypothetical protein
LFDKSTVNRGRISVSGLRLDEVKTGLPPAARHRKLKIESGQFFLWKGGEKYLELAMKITLD